MPTQFVVRGVRKPRPRPSGVLVHGLSQEQIDAYNADNPESHRFRTPGKVYESLEYFDTLTEEPSTRFSQSLNEESLEQMSGGAHQDKNTEVERELKSSTPTTPGMDTDKAAARLQAAQRGHQVRASNQNGAEESHQQRTATAATQVQAAQRGRRSRLVQNERAAAAVRMQARERGRQARMMEYERNETRAHTAAVKVQAVLRGHLAREELKSITEEEVCRSSVQLAPTLVAAPVPAASEVATGDGAAEQDITLTLTEPIKTGVKSSTSAADLVMVSKSVEQGTQTGDAEEEGPGPTAGPEPSAARSNVHASAIVEAPAAAAPVPAASEVATGDAAAGQETTLPDGVQEMLTAFVAEAIKAGVETWAAEKEAELAQRTAVAEVDAIDAAAAPTSSVTDVPDLGNAPKAAAETPTDERAATNTFGAKAAKDQGSQTARPGTTPADGSGVKAARGPGSQTARPAETLAGARTPAVTAAAKPDVRAAAEPVAAAAAAAAAEPVAAAAAAAAAETIVEASAESTAEIATEQVASATPEQVAPAASAEARATQDSTAAAAAASEAAANGDAENAKLVDAQSLPVCPHQQSSPSAHEAHPGASPMWESMWSKGIGKGEAFDIGSASGTLLGYLSRTPKLHLAQGATALVPGCGRAYDALALASHGYSSVVAIDLSSTAVEAAKEELKTAADTEAAARVDVCCDDFFSYKGQFDLIWDCTFLCALEPSVRAEWAKQQKSLLKQGGLLLTCIFPIVDKEGGPPFAMSVPLVRDLVEAEGFECAELKEQLADAEMHKNGAFNTPPNTAFAAWRKPS